MGYSYSYDVTVCPGCGADLTAERAIDLTVVIAEVPNRGIPTRLREDGALMDVDRLVANGYHGGTACMKCGESLEEHEVEN